jgi:hypothetical protein
MNPLVRNFYLKGIFAIKTEVEICSCAVYHRCKGCFSPVIGKLHATELDIDSSAVGLVRFHCTHGAKPSITATLCLSSIVGNDNATGN